MLFHKVLLKRAAGCMPMRWPISPFYILSALYLSIFTFCWPWIRMIGCMSCYLRLSSSCISILCLSVYYYDYYYYSRLMNITFGILWRILAWPAHVLEGFYGWPNKVSIHILVTSECSVSWSLRWKTENRVVGGLFRQTRVKIRLRTTGSKVSVAPTGHDLAQPCLFESRCPVLQVRLESACHPFVIKFYLFYIFLIFISLIYFHFSYK